MSGLISSLQNSSAALRVHSKGLETVGKNLANINNPAYAKQRVAIGDRGQINTGIATEMMGVEAMELRQNRDSMLDKGVMRELNASSALEAAKHVLESAETALGQFLDRTEDGTSIQNVTGPTGGGISDALTDFFNAWESFSVKPNDIAEKQLLIAKAQILADKFNGTDKRLNQVQLDVDQQVETDLIVVNDLLNEIAEINSFIAKAENVKPFSAVDLRDQRQAKLEELSKYVDLTFNPYDPDPASTDSFKSLGRIDVYLNQANGSLQQIIDGSDVSVDSTTAFTYDSENRILSFGGIEFTDATIPNGKLSARLNAATDTVADTRESILALAEHLEEEVNTAYQAAGGAGNVFNLSTTTAGLINLSYNSALELKAGATGGNQMALAVAELGTRVYSTTGIAEFESTEPHGFLDGDKVYSTENGLMWIASGIDPEKVGVTEENTYYLVEKISDTSFSLKSDEDEAIYLDEITATSPITTVTEYEELNAESALSPRIVPYITEFSFPDDTFSDGDEIQFTALPPDTADETLDSKLVYTLQKNTNGTFSILKPDGTDLQITEDDIYALDRSFTPTIKQVGEVSNTTSLVSSITFGGEFYGDFVLADTASFSSGDQVKFTNLPEGSAFEEDVVYTVSTLTVDATTGALLTDGDTAGTTVYQFNDINGNPIIGVGISSIDGDTEVVLLTQSSESKTSSIDAEAFDSENGNFWGQLILDDPTGFSVGQTVAFNNLPDGSTLSVTESYIISELTTSASGDTLITLVDSNGDSIAVGLSDVDGDTSIVFQEINVEGDLVSFSQLSQFDGSFAGNFNSIVTVLAQELNTTNIRLEDQELSEKMALETRDQYSGVSQDEEVTDMMKFQRRFQASARHINIIDTLLDQIVNRLGIG